MKVGYSLILFCLALSLWANEETEFVIPKIVKNHNGVMTVINSESLNQFIRPKKDNFNSDYLKKLVQKYKDPQNTPDKSCLFYTRSYRSDPIPKGYLEMLGATFLESICTSTHTSSVFQGRKTLPKQYFDVLTKIKSLGANPPDIGNLSKDGKVEFNTECKFHFGDSKASTQEAYFKDLKSNLTKAKELIDSNTPSNPINLALNYSMLTPLGIDETGAYPLTGKHTDSASEANWESGLFHLSTDSFYAEDDVKTDAIKDMNDQPIHSNDLKKTFLSYIAQIQRIAYLPKEEALPTFSKFCGLDSINKDFFEKYFDEYKKRNPKMDPKKVFKNLSQEPFNYERDYSPESILNLFKQLFENEKSPQTVVSFLHNDIKNPSLRMINEQFLKSGDEFSLHFIDTFRKLQYYCPKFATQYTAISLKINATHQGSIKRDSLYPHCLKFYLELTKDKENACKI
jgi:hypothetical protein